MKEKSRKKRFEELRDSMWGLSENNRSWLVVCLLDIQYSVQACDDAKSRKLVQELLEAVADVV